MRNGRGIVERKLVDLSSETKSREFLQMMAEISLVENRSFCKGRGDGVCVDGVWTSGGELRSLALLRGDLRCCRVVTCLTGAAVECRRSRGDDLVVVHRSVFRH